MAFITAETRSDIIALVVTMLDRAPDDALLNELVTASTSGKSLGEIADMIAAKEEFTDANPASQTAEEYATAALARVLDGTGVSAEAEAEAIELATSYLNDGMSKAELAMEINAYLSQPSVLLDANFGDVAQTFVNKNTVAEYYVLDADLGDLTTAELTAALASVTAEADSVTAATDAADATAAAEDVVAGQTFTLTTSAETLTGGAGNDSFVAVVSGVGAAGTTILPGDSLNGGAGDDTLTISTAGAPNAAYTIAAIQSKGIENVMFNAFDTDNTADGTVLDLTLMDGVSKVGVASGSATGDIEVTNAKSIIDVSLANSAGDFKVSYPAGVTSALKGDQTQNIALTNVSAGAVTIDGVEIVNVTTSLANSTLASLAIDAATTLNVSGDKNLTITAAVDFKDTASAVPSAIDGTIDASGLTGKLTISPNASDNMKITGGSADDKFVMGAGMNGYDVIDGGEGTDTITMNAAAITTQFAQTSNVEIVQFNASAAAIGIDASKVGAANIIVDLNDADDTDGALLASSVTKADGKTIWIAKSVEDDADADDSDGTKLTITEAVDTADDTANIVLMNIGEDNDTATDYFGIDEIDVATYEAVNITANANALGTNKLNEVETLTATNATSVTVTGTGSLETVLAATASKFTSFDASGLAGALKLTAGAEKATYKLGASSSTLTMGSNLNASDTIVGGAGTADTVTATVTGLTATTGALSIADVEKINLTTSGANTLDMASVTGKHTLAVTDNKQTIKNFDLANTIQLGLAADEAATSSEIDVTAADATGTDDTLSVTVDNTAGNVSSIIDASNIENLALKIVDDTQSVTLDMTTGEFNAISIAMKDATDNGAVDLGTLHKNTTSLTSGTIGAVTASFANQVAPNGSAVTFSGLGTAIQTITGGAFGDTFTIGSTGNITHAITGGAGTDTTNITVGAAFVNAGSIDTENVNMTVASGADVSLSGATFHSGVDAVVLTGGNSLSTFTSGTLHTNLKSIDASGFDGNVALTLAIDAADTGVSFTGGSLLTDSLSYEIDNVGTDVIKSTGIETLVVNFDASATMSLASTDAAAINVDVAEAATTATVSNAEGTLVRVTKAAADSAVTVTLADSTGTEDTLAMELDEGASAGALVDGMNINVADVEAVSIKVDDDVSVDLSGLSMTTAGKTMGLTLTGNNTLTISALGTDVTTINASGKLAGGVVQTGRSTTGTVEYTGGAGADTFIMTNLGDTLVGGKGTDTLDVNYSAILGGINVNLASTTNQIVSANGSAISGSVTGFENVDLSGYTGSFGALIASGSSATAGTTASITGTANADQINLSSGVDTVVIGLTSSDTISSFSTAADKIQLASATFGVGDYAEAAAIAAGANADVTVATTALANDAAIVTAIQTSTDTTDTLFIVFNTADNEAQAWYDANPNVDGGEVQVATLVGITDLTDFAAANFTFV